MHRIRIGITTQTPPLRPPAPRTDHNGRRRALGLRRLPGEREFHVGTGGADDVRTSAPGVRAVFEIAMGGFPGPS